MVDEKLGVIVKQFSQCFGSLGSLEDIWFCDLDPGKGADFCGEGVMFASELLFFFEQFVASSIPFLEGHDMMLDF